MTGARITAMRRRATWLGIAIAVTWSGLAAAQSSTELAAANASAKSFCDPAIVAFDADIGKVTPGLDAFERMLAAAQDEQDKTAKAGTASPNAPAVLAQAAMIKQVIHDQIAAAKVARAQATALLERADATRDPAAAAVDYKDALAKIEAARGWLGKAATTLSLPAQPAETAARRIDIKGDFGALRQLQQLSRDLSAAGENGNQLGVLLQDWDAAASRTMAVAAPPDDLAFGIRRYDEASKTLTTADGRTISLRPLERALATTAATGKPPFHPVPAPGGGAALQPAPELMRALANRDTRRTIETVGGVALDITFELLSQAGLSDFGSNRPLAYVERPVMLSLSTLFARVKSYARSEREWRSLPDDLRYPGNLGRIHGYVLDPARKDVFIVGAAADQAHERIDIDALSILLATTWRNGQVPAVSLDPVPSDPAGPQYPRIINVPPDSVVAKAMLDADYEMKRLTFGLRRVPDIGFTAYPDLIKTAIDVGAGEGAARFWFYPVPLREHAVKVSASGRSLLFASSVQVLTESMTIENGALVPTGKVGGIERQVAESFTAAYDALAHSEQVQPPGIFQRLHGLVDMTTLGVLLRRAGVEYAILDQISRLPHRRLTGADAVPAWYPGLTTSITLADTSHPYVISGGVEMRARALRQSVEAHDDLPIRALERTADAFRPGRDLVAIAPLPVSVIVAVADGERERRMLAAFRALGAGDHLRASQSFAEITKLDPLNIEAWAHLASALTGLGRHGEAKAAITRALALDSGDLLVRALALDVALKSNPGADPLAYGADALRALSQEYVTRAFGAIAAGQREPAIALADRALKLADDNVDAYLARAWAHNGAQPEAERRDIVEALRFSRRQAREASAGAAPARLAFLLAVSASQRVQRASRYALGIRDGAAEQDVNFLIAEMQRAAEEAKEASKLDPTQAFAVAVEVQARIFRIRLLKDAGQPTTTAPVRQLLDDGLTRFANFPAMHMAHAVVAIADERNADAIAALGETIRLAPGDGNAYGLRAMVQADLGRCAEARADQAQAESLRAVIGAAERETVARCR